MGYLLGSILFFYAKVLVTSAAGPWTIQPPTFTGTLSTQRLQPCTVLKVGGGMVQGPATEVTHLWSNQCRTSIFFFPV